MAGASEFHPESSVLPVEVNRGLRSSVLLSFLFCNLLVFAAPEVNQQALLYFRQAQTHYDAKEYLLAKPAFEKAVELAPAVSIYRHMLGKCYGRIAEHGNWLTALKYVRKTLAQFKKAVELDEENMQAWADLEEFYRRAPGFLGGDEDKAAEIRLKLKQWKDAGNSQQAVSE